MSQILYRYKTGDGEEREVQTGWDAPLHYAHFTVFSVPGDEVVFSDLQFENPFKLRPADVIKHFDELGVPYPPNLEMILTDHMNMNMGNLVVHLSIPEMKGVQA